MTRKSVRDGELSNEADAARAATAIRAFVISRPPKEVGNVENLRSCAT